MKTLVILGTFDGVHRGHLRLLRRFLSLARQAKLTPRALLFDRPPRFFFSPPHAPSLLTTTKERAELFRAIGVSDLRFLRFSKTWAEMSHVRFFEKFLLDRCGCRGLLVGPDFAFGKDRLGDVDWLRKACRREGIRFEVASMLATRGQKVSSSRIRNLLHSGEVEEAARLLGRPYALQGTVIRGQGLGRKLGVPTANLRVDSSKLLPPGVFKVRVHSANWKKPKSALCNVGVRPTIGGSSRVHVEIHVPGFSGDLYGRTLKVEFLRKIRPEMKFPSLKALKAQILKDIRFARE